MKKERNYFPLGIATGSAFCNRQQETQILVDNILQGKHSLLVAIRRYGKSSLALKALKQADLPCVEIDFYMASDEAVVAEYILNGVVELIGKACGSVEKLITTIKKTVKTLQPKLDINASVLQLELTAEKTSDPASNVKEALLLLERLLTEKKQQAVLLLDEFQNVGVQAQGAGIEAAIRHVAQKTKYLTFIFSGSNRKLLAAMFEDSHRPLYKLCWKIVLKRITAEHYHKHINKVAKTVWGEVLDKKVIDKILQLTERHPFYVNKLCDRLLVFTPQMVPTVRNVETAWCSILEEDKSDAVKDISLLPTSQKKVLLQVAKNNAAHLASKHAVIGMQMAPSSIKTAAEGLEKKDVIEQFDNHYHVVNPVVKHFVLISG